MSFFNQVIIYDDIRTKTRLKLPRKATLWDFPRGGRRVMDCELLDGIYNPFTKSYENFTQLHISNLEYLCGVNLLA